MSEAIPLRAVPNQTVVVVLAGLRYSITLQQVGNVMAATIERANVVVVRGMRVVAGTPVLPYAYLEAGAGNFIFTASSDDTIPFWTDFEVDCRLVYLSAAEMEAARNGTA